MLDVMRKHTESWLIKVVFALIILVFIFFFGYSKMQKGGQGAGIAARVNGEVVPYGLYKLALENSREFYSKVFGEKIPENMWPQIRSSALYQVINQELLNQLAKELGIEVTDTELFQLISENPNFQTDGQFDPYSYKNNFLSYFERRYGINYEELLRTELTAQKTANFISNGVTIPEVEAKEEYDREKSSWTFESIVIPEKPKDGVKYDVGTEEIAKNISEAQKANSKAKINQSVRKYKLDKQLLEDISMESRTRLIPTANSEEPFIKIFSLTKESPSLETPIKSGSKWYAIKLVDLKEPTSADWEKDKDDFSKDLLQKKKQEYQKEWLDNLRKKAAIEEYVLSTER